MTDPRIAGVGTTPATTPVERTGRPTRGTAAAGGDFDRLLRARLDGTTRSEPLRWSAHARERLVQRGIAMTPESLQRLDGAVAKAAAKGSRESLVLMDDMAFVVSVTNRTVITAVDRAGMREHVFTNIDSAVLS